MANLRRRECELKSLIEFEKANPRFRFHKLEDIDAPSHYEVTITGRSLVYDQEKHIVSFTSEDQEHIAEVIMGRNYPYEPPEIKWKTEIYHPNIYGGKVCILGGLWDPERTLADVCRQIMEMVQFKNFDPNNPLPSATSPANWVKRELIDSPDTFPTDPRPINMPQSES